MMVVRSVRITTMDAAGNQRAITARIQYTHPSALNSLLGINDKEIVMKSSDYDYNEQEFCCLAEAIDEGVKAGLRASIIFDIVGLVGTLALLLIVYLCN